MCLGKGPAALPVLLDKWTQGPRDTADCFLLPSVACPPAWALEAPVSDLCCRTWERVDLCGRVRNPNILDSYLDFAAG